MYQQQLQILIIVMLCFMAAIQVQIVRILYNMSAKLIEIALLLNKPDDADWWKESDNKADESNQ